MGKVSVDKKIFEKFPSFKRKILIIEDINNSKKSKHIEELLKGVIAERMQTSLEDERIQCWEDVHQLFGSNPSAFPPSLKMILKRIQKSGEFPYINSVVAAFNYICIKYLVSCGADDFSEINGDACLTFATGNESFLGLGSKENDSPKKGEVIYVDSKDNVMCRRWNWRNGAKTKITPESKNIVINIEAFTHIISDSELEKAQKELADLLEKECGAKIKLAELTLDSPECVLPFVEDEISSEFTELLNRGVAEINVRENLEKKLKEGKKLRVKFGIDPTGFDLTLGHAVPLRKLKAFQDAGHQVVLLFGNFTAQIGDPTGKSQARKILTKEDVETNAKTYLKQAAKILDINNIELVYNADWLEKMSFSDVLKLAGNFTVAQMLERDMFQERMKKSQQINLVEFMYPLMQGYDSVPIRADVEIGGTDQLFNMMCARPLQKAYGVPVQNVITVPILVGLDGHEKMSKSLGNYIALNDSASDMFGKTMSIPDALIINYFELATGVSLEEIKKIEKELSKSDVNPRDIKIRLAKEIVTLYHTAKDADEAEQNFLQVFQKGGIPEDIAEIDLAKEETQLWALINATKLCGSSSNAKQMIEQGSVKIDGEKFADKNEMIQVKSEMIIQVGKRKWVKIV